MCSREQLGLTSRVLIRFPATADPWGEVRHSPRSGYALGGHADVLRWLSGLTQRPPLQCEDGANTSRRAGVHRCGIWVVHTLDSRGDDGREAVAARTGRDGRGGRDERGHCWVIFGPSAAS